MSLYNLALFFRVGRRPNGSFVGEDESVQNATERNLACLSDAEILAHREGARQFMVMCDAEMLSRNVEPDPDAKAAQDELDEAERLDGIEADRELRECAS